MQLLGPPALRVPGQLIVKFYPAELCRAIDVDAWLEWLWIIYMTFQSREQVSQTAERD